MSIARAQGWFLLRDVRRKPIAFTLESVGRQWHLVTIVSVVNLLPIDRGSRHIHRGQALEHLLPINATRSQAGEPVEIRLHAFPAMIYERGLGTNLQHDLASAAREL